MTRWPAAWMELLFNAAFLGWVVLATASRWTPGNRFHVYLIAYGAFRFAHEFARDNAIMIHPFTGYHVIALAIVGFGCVRFVQRRRARDVPSIVPDRDAAPPSPIDVAHRRA